jgi:hypothetical protein
MGVDRSSSGGHSGIRPTELSSSSNGNILNLPACRLARTVSGCGIQQCGVVISRRNVLEENLPHSYLAHHKSHMHCRSTELTHTMTIANKCNVAEA